uniref:Uncharacterized protein n=1 Tax=Phytophthora sansomeana TaxID=555429 RepID=A0A5J6DTR5_9STRA|nr:hypothetical protein [Phytophthora sansomeana]QES94834.1 hypothetical protein [Phytophthora sansomeana]
MAMQFILNIICFSYYLIITIMYFFIFKNKVTSIYNILYIHYFYFFKIILNNLIKNFKYIYLKLFKVITLKTSQSKVIIKSNTTSIIILKFIPTFILVIITIIYIYIFNIEIAGPAFCMEINNIINDDIIERISFHRRIMFEDFVREILATVSIPDPRFDTFFDNFNSINIRNHPELWKHELDTAFDDICDMLSPTAKLIRITDHNGIYNYYRNLMSNYDIEVGIPITQEFHENRLQDVWNLINFSNLNINILDVTNITNIHVRNLEMDINSFKNILNRVIKQLILETRNNETSIHIIPFIWASWRDSLNCLSQMNDQIIEERAQLTGNSENVINSITVLDNFYAYLEKCITAFHYKEEVTSEIYTEIQRNTTVLSNPPSDYTTPVNTDITVRESRSSSSSDE